jgi:probable phosphoglycerate mutase
MVDRIYLARHGETSLNAAGLLRGRLDPPLTDKGQLQADALADFLKDAPIRLIVASPLRRAVETARAVANRMGLAVEVDVRFNDRDYGKWAGTSLEDVQAQWGSIDNAPGVEPRDLVVERSLSGFRYVAERLGDEAGLIVSHDAINRLLLVALDASLDGLTLPQETGCYNVLKSCDEGWKALSVNDIPPIDP